MPSENKYSGEANKSKCWNYGRTKENRPNEVGWIDEQCSKCCGGDGNGRSSIFLEKSDSHRKLVWIMLQLSRFFDS